MHADIPPLTPADCDLRDFAFMPLDVDRLRDSDMTSLVSGDEFRSAVLLWCASWHQYPAGSLPDDDRVLSSLAGFGFAVDSWRAIKAGAMHGWIKCADGRLYHPVVAEKARDAWRGKLKQRWETEKGRVKKHNQRHGTSFVVPEFDDWLSLGRPITVLGDMPDLSPGTSGDCPGSVPPKNASKGEREGQREGQGELTKKSGGGIPRASSPVDKSAPPLSAEQLGEKLIALEVEKGRTLLLSSRARETLLRIASRGITLPVLLRAHDLACARRTADADTSPVNPGFLESFIGEAQAAASGNGPAEAWDTTNEGVASRATELGIEPMRPDEKPYQFRLRVIRDSGDEALIEREVGKAARANPADHERMHRFMYGCAPGELSTA